AGRPVLPPVASGIGHRHLLQRRLTMIMQRATPKQLGWLGVLGVIGLGVIALPVLPSLAQTTAQEKPGSDAVQLPTTTTSASQTSHYDMYHNKNYCALCHAVAPKLDDEAECAYVKTSKEYRLVEARLKELQSRLAKLEGNNVSLAEFLSAGLAEARP